MPGRHVDAAARADRAVADLGGDLAHSSASLAAPGERVATLVHRRRASVRSLTEPGDARALDTEGAEHDPERQTEQLEHGPLLDVELQVRAGALELRPRLERTLELDTVSARARPAALSRPVASARRSSA